MAILLRLSVAFIHPTISFKRITRRTRNENPFGRLRSKRMVGFGMGNMKSNLEKRMDAYIKKHKIDLSAPLTPKICLIYRWVPKRKEWGPCRRKATKHNGLAWFCAECYRKHYGKMEAEIKRGLRQCKLSSNGEHIPTIKVHSFGKRYCFYCEQVIQFNGKQWVTVL